MFAHEFVRNAYLAGTFIALACGTIGWFVVAPRRRCSPATRSAMSRSWARSARPCVGVDERVGLFVLTLALAGAMGALGPRAQADDVAIGTAFAWILGIGVLLLAILATSPGGASGITTANTLFGSIYSLSAGGVGARRGGRAGRRPRSCWRSPGHCCWPRSSRSWRSLRGVPVRLLGLGFLAALAIVTAESTQAVGALLLLGLIAAPAGAAQRADGAAVRSGVALSGALAVGSMWGGLALSYAIGPLPPSSAIIGLAAGCYAAASASVGLGATPPARRRSAPAQGVSEVRRAMPGRES